MNYQNSANHKTEMEATRGFVVNAYSNDYGKLYSYEAEKIWEAAKAAQEFLGFVSIDRVEIIHNR